MSRYEPIEIRFARMVVKSEGDLCWDWSGYRTRQGYGIIGVGRRTERAHRVSWELHRGPIPDGLWVLHKCDNPPCTNPDHLFLGTVQDNTDDMYRKGRGRKATGLANGRYTKPERTARGDRHKSRTKPETIRRGVDHPDAKLTDALVLEIREKYALGGHTHAGLAAEYGVNQASMKAVLLHETWAHVGGPKYPRQHRLSLEDKLCLRFWLDAGVKPTHLAAAFGVSDGTLTHIRQAEF